MYRSKYIITDEILFESLKQPPLHYETEGSEYIDFNKDRLRF